MLARTLTLDNFICAGDPKACKTAEQRAPTCPKPRAHPQREPKRLAGWPEAAQQGCIPHTVLNPQLERDSPRQAARDDSTLLARGKSAETFFANLFAEPAAVTDEVSALQEEPLEGSPVIPAAGPETRPLTTPGPEVAAEGIEGGGNFQASIPKEDPASGTGTSTAPGSVHHVDESAEGRQQAPGRPHAGTAGGDTATEEKGTEELRPQREPKLLEPGSPPRRTPRPPAVTREASRSQTPLRHVPDASSQA